MIDRSTLRDHANSLARALFGGLPLGFWEAAFPKDLIALCYHMVSDVELPYFQLFEYKNSAQFRADVAFARPRAVTYQMLVDHRLRNAPLPRNSVLFTFDDGFAECFTVMRPILREFGVDGVFFVTTNMLDDRTTFFESTLSLCLGAIRALSNDAAAEIARRLDIDAQAADPARLAVTAHREEQLRFALDGDERKRALYRWALGLDRADAPRLARACELLGVDATAQAYRPIFMSKAQVRQLVDEGFTVGAHGLDHRLLERLSIDEIEAEIVASVDAVRAITGRDRIPFAFPHTGLQVSRDQIAGILARNPQVELIFDSGMLRRDPDFIVNRVFADQPGESMDSNVSATLRDAWAIPSAWFRST